MLKRAIIVVNKVHHMGFALELLMLGLCGHGLYVFTELLLFEYKNMKQLVFSAMLFTDVVLLIMAVYFIEQLYQATRRFILKEPRKTKVTLSKTEHLNLVSIPPTRDNAVDAPPPCVKDPIFPRMTTAQNLFDGVDPTRTLIICGLTFSNPRCLKTGGNDVLVYAYRLTPFDAKYTHMICIIAENKPDAVHFRSYVRIDPRCRCSCRNIQTSFITNDWTTSTDQYNNGLTMMLLTSIQHGIDKIIVKHPPKTSCEDVVVVKNHHELLRLARQLKALLDDIS